MRNKLFVEDEPPTARRGVLFRGVTMLDEKATLQSVHAVLEDLPESERILPWIFLSEQPIGTLVFLRWRPDTPGEEAPEVVQRALALPGTQKYAVRSTLPPPRQAT